MKKLLAALAAITVLALPLASCKNAGESDKLSIVTTIFPQFDFARRVAGDKADIKMLLPPGSEAHFYEPTITDMSAINSCDLLIAAGGSVDSWIDASVAACDNEIRVLRMADCVSLVQEEYIEGMEHEEHSHGQDEHEEEEVEYDEHIWTSPVNAMKIVAAIRDSLAEIDADNADYYRDNASQLISELQSLDASFRETVAGARTKTLVFAERFPFRYFADEYGLSYFAAFSGCSSQSEPTVQTVGFLVNKIKAEHIRAVFYIEFSTQTVADTICAETGAEKLLFHSCHNVSKEDFQSGVTYLDLMRNNLANLREALK